MIEFMQAGELERISAYFQLALNRFLLLSQGRKRLAEGPECLSKETHETSGNYEAGQQNQ